MPDEHFLLYDSLLSGTVLASLAYAGALAVWLILWRQSIFVRFSVAAWLLSPALAIGAVEIFWLLGLEVVLIWLEIGLAGRLIFGCAVRNALPDGVDRVAKADARVISIRAIMGVTTLIAGLAALVRFTPGLNAPGWFSIAIIALASSWCISLAWLSVRLHLNGRMLWPLAMVITLTMGGLLVSTDWLLPGLSDYTFGGWPPDPRWNARRIPLAWLLILPALFFCMSWLIVHGQLIAQSLNRRLQVPRRTRRFDTLARWTGLVVPVALITLWLGWLSVRMLRMQWEAKVLQPIPSAAAEEFARRALALELSPLETARATYGDFQHVPAEELQTLLTSAEDDLQQVIQLAKEPQINRVIFARREHNLNIRPIVEALMARGQSMRQTQSEAMFDALEAAVLLSAKASRGGLIIHEMNARGSLHTSARHLARNLHLCSNQRRAELIARLKAVQGSAEPIDRLVARDEAWKRSLGWDHRLHSVLDSLTRTSDQSLLESTLQLYRRDQLATLQVLIAESAIASFRSDHGRCPRSLSELIPAYLDAMPEDPYSSLSEPLRYRSDDASSYVVYSIGVNGQDDAGDSFYAPGKLDGGDIQLQ